MGAVTMHFADWIQADWIQTALPRFAWMSTQMVKLGEVLSLLQHNKAGLICSFKPLNNHHQMLECQEK